MPILTTPIPGEGAEQVVAWAVEREPSGKNGGRGFGFTGGHFFENWGVENFRRMVLNAILWTAHLEVPAGGVRSQTASPSTDATASGRRRTHSRRRSSPATIIPRTSGAIRRLPCRRRLAQDKRMQVTVVTDPEFLATDELARL